MTQDQAFNDNPEETESLIRWKARRMHPIILLYAAGVFLAMMAVAYWVLHSPTAVKAMFLGAIGFLVPLVPSIINPLEYRLTGEVLEKRPTGGDQERQFKTVFEVARLGYIVPGSRGFKFYLAFDEANPAKRFWKKHFSDSCSGEVHVEKAEREDVLKILAGRGVSIR